MRCTYDTSHRKCDFLTLNVKANTSNQVSLQCFSRRSEKCTSYYFLDENLVMFLNREKTNCSWCACLVCDLTLFKFNFNLVLKLSGTSKACSKVEKSLNHLIQDWLRARVSNVLVMFFFLSRSFSAAVILIVVVVASVL